LFQRCVIHRIALATPLRLAFTSLRPPGPYLLATLTWCIGMPRPNRQAGDPTGAITTPNDARATVAGLAPLTDPGTDRARIDHLPRARLLVLLDRTPARRFATPHSPVRPCPGERLPDRSLAQGGNYGTDVNVPVPQAEQNNPNVGANTCMDRTPDRVVSVAPGIACAAVPGAIA